MARADIENLASGVGFRCSKECRGHIRNEGEIARLRAIANYCERHAGKFLFQKNPEDRAISSCGATARAIDIKEAERKRRELINPVPMHDHFFAHELREGVGMLWLAGSGLRRGIELGDAVAGRAGGIEEALDAEIASKLQRAECAIHIDAKVVFGIDDRWHKIRSPGQVEKPVAFGKWQVCFRYAADVFFQKTKSSPTACGLEVFQSPRAEVINAENLVSIPEKGVHKVAADKA